MCMQFLRIILIVCSICFLVCATQSVIPRYRLNPISTQTLHSTSNIPPSPQSSTPHRASASQPPLGDYVPCLFDENETSALRAIAKPKLQNDIPLDEPKADAVTKHKRGIV